MYRRFIVIVFQTGQSGLELQVSHNAHDNTICIETLPGESVNVFSQCMCLNIVGQFCCVTMDCF